MKLLTTTVAAFLTVSSFTTAWPAISGRDAPAVDQVELKAQEDAKHRARIDFENSKKYFHEPAGHEEGDDPLLGHYDTRFFKGKLEYRDKRAVQLHMVRAYLDTFRQRDIETWIAHGTLLGWWWNGMMLPWDWDIDTQVMDSTLFYLGRELNNTRHTYATTIDGKQVSATYLMDVNPAAAERTNGDGFNIIDARWINVDNGMYIDITGLSELNGDESPGVVSCKNFHDYNLSDIHPLRETEFEGVPALVPYDYGRLLSDEYGDGSLVVTEYESHRWDPNERLWVQQGG
jgi:hypothetical protein